MDQQKAKQIFIVTCFGYFAFGLLNAVIGPLLEQFAGSNGVSLDAIGGLFTAIFLGSLTGQLVFGPITDRSGQLRGLTIAFLFLAPLMTAMTLSNWLPLTLALAYLAGIAYGTAVLCGNIMVGRIFSANSISALNWLNVFFGVGNIAGPLLVSFSLLAWKNGFPALWVGTFLMVISALMLGLFFFKTKIGSTTEVEQTRTRLKIDPFLLTLAAMILIYVGSEGAMGGWTTTYMHSTTSLLIDQAALVTAGFWLALTLGRVMGAVLGSRIQSQSLLRLCLGISLAGALLFMLGFGYEVWSIVAIFVMGFGFGPIYPTIIGVTTNRYKSASGQAGSIITSMGSISGALIPWLQGVILVNLGMRYGTYLMAFLMTLLVLVFILNQRERKRAAI